MPEECYVACAFASTKFEEICRKLEKGEVSLSELHRIKEKEQHMRRLCEAVTGGESPQDVVLSALQQRLNEYNYFSDRRCAYLEIYNRINDPQYSGNIGGTYLHV